MTFWRRGLILLCCVLDCVEFSSSSLILQRNKYNNSFRLTRSTRTRVQHLQRKYNEQQLGNKHFEDRSRRLKDLPSLSTDFYGWLNLTEFDRLLAALLDMQAYWTKLEQKRQQIEKEAKEQMVKRGTTLPRSIRHIQHDLRDLMSHVSSQMSYKNSSWTKPTFPTPLNPQTRSKTVWDSRVDGYIILRDLDLYLTKLARDFLLLASQTL